MPSLARRLAATAAAALLSAACGERDTPSTAPQPAAPPAGLVSALAAAAHPLTGAADDHDPLVALAADARVVLLGESTHGTHEFYRERAEITQRLITELGYDAVVIEGDWPEAARVNRWVRGVGSDASAEEALAGFTDFPRWMWRNTDVRDFVRWLRAHNDAQPTEGDAGFYGMDVYSLYESAAAVVQYLATVDAAAAARVEEHYDCFMAHAPDPQRYGAATRGGPSCEEEAEAALAEVERALATRPADPLQAEARFSALRDAQAVVSSEAYFRGLYEGGESTWNLRDRAMAATLDAIAAHVEATKGRPARLAVWTHNSHVGDASATDMGTMGEITLGQLARQRHGAAALLVGQLTYGGQVMAADDWDRPGRVVTVRPALAGSHADILHATGIPRFLLVLRGDPTVAAPLDAARLHRAIGVVYLPNTERQSHYFDARLASQFDAVLFHDVTSAVTPLP